MSSTDPEGTDPEHNLTPSEIEHLDRLEAIAQRGLGTYVQVGNAFAGIRDWRLYRVSHPSFETYVRERWGLDLPGGDPLSPSTVSADAPATSATDREPRMALRYKPCEALARVCEQTLTAIADDERMDVEIRLAVRKHGGTDIRGDGQSSVAWHVGGPTNEELFLALRWLLSQARGTVGEVAHHLESRAADVDDGAREQLRDDVLGLEGELAVVKALLADVIDWDLELKRLLRDELRPSDSDADPENDE